MKNKEVKIIQQATDEATEELEAMDIKYTSGIKDFLVWIDLVKQKLIKYLN
jgi:hypothetical protein